MIDRRAAELDAIAAAASRFADATPLHHALELWRAPWRLVVVGRIGVGKSSLVNALHGEPGQATGLGGVTTTAAEVPLPDDVIVVDTPGMDGEHAVPPVLDALLVEADALAWVVDGLQPITRSERRALRRRIPARTHVHVVVSRVDLLDADEVPSVLQRVRVLTSEWQPCSIRPSDLRTAARGSASDLADIGEPAPWPPSRRADPMARALSALRDAVRQAPLPDPTAVHHETARAWREAVRETEAAVAREVHDGLLDHRVPAEQRFLAAAATRRDAFALRAIQIAGDLGRLGPPRIPLPEQSGRGGLDLAGGMGGAGSALRALRILAGRWMMEGELALTEWITPALSDPVIAQTRRTHAKLGHALDEALERLTAGVMDASPPC